VLKLGKQGLNIYIFNKMWGIIIMKLWLVGLCMSLRGNGNDYLVEQFVS
jgi:hypothetical protein